MQEVGCRQKLASYVCSCHLPQGLLGQHTGLKKMGETTFEVAFSFPKNIIETSRKIGKNLVNPLLAEKKKKNHISKPSTGKTIGA